MAAVSEMPKLAQKRWTYADYCSIDDDRRYEIFDGELLPLEPPSPGASHQRESRTLFRIIYDFVTARGLGEVFYAPFDVILDDVNVVQPDLLFIARDHISMVQERGVFGAPDLVVEIISPGSGQRDRDRKKLLYARFGIPEYWLADRAKRSVEVLVLEKDIYRDRTTAAALKRGVVTSRMLKGLIVTVKDLFR